MSPERGRRSGVRRLLRFPGYVRKRLAARRRAEADASRRLLIFMALCAGTDTILGLSRVILDGLRQPVVPAVVQKTGVDSVAFVLLEAGTGDPLVTEAGDRILLESPAR
jgi:hypothetical protein